MDNESGNPLPPLHGLFIGSAARVPLYAPSHRQDNTYHHLCFTSCRALAGMGNSRHGKKDNRLYNQRKEGNVLFNDALNTFLFTVIWRQYNQRKKQSDSHHTDKSGVKRTREANLVRPHSEAAFPRLGVFVQEVVQHAKHLLHHRVLAQVVSALHQRNRQLGHTTQNQIM